jgi:hypothetical protein
LLIEKISQATGKCNTREIEIDPIDYIKWSAGYYGHVQDAFPDLSYDDREFLISGTTPEEWDAIFESEEDDDFTGYELADTSDGNDHTGLQPGEGDRY